MFIYFHFSVAGFSNCYLLGADGPGDAIIVDPGMVTVPLIRAIEDGGFRIATVLLTHRHDSHVKGLRTLLRIYDAEVFAGAETALDLPCTRLEDGDTIERHGVEIGAMAFSGHSSDSIVYRIDSFLFTGDVLGAGKLGSTPNAYAKALQVEAIKKRLFSIPGDLLIFPGHGPPTTLDAERRLNPSLKI